MSRLASMPGLLGSLGPISVGVLPTSPLHTNATTADVSHGRARTATQSGVEAHLENCWKKVCKSDGE